MSVELVVIGFVLATVTTVSGVLILRKMRQVDEVLDAAEEAAEEDQEEFEKIAGVEKDLTRLYSLIDGRKNTQVIYAACNEFEHLNNVEGFASVVTLFKHRHRKRALERLEIFCQEWRENGLKLYGRI